MASEPGDDALKRGSEADAVLRVEQLRLQLAGMPLSLSGSLILALIAVVVVWPNADKLLLGGWVTALVLVVLVRVALLRAWHAVADWTHDAARWRRYFVAGNFAMGTAWGTLSVLLMPADDIYAQIFSAFVIAGVSASAVLTLSGDRRAALAFVLPCVLPLAAQLLVRPDRISVVMGVMVLMYLSMVIIAMHRAHAQLRENVSLRLEAFARERSRKQSEEELARAHGQLRSVLDAATRISIIATDLNGRITIFNTGAERMLGYTAQEMVGIATPELIHLPAEIEQRSVQLSAELGYPVLGCEVLLAKARLNQSEEHTWTYVRKDGSHLTVNLIITAVRDGAGQPVGYLGIAIDISERQRAAEELRASEEKLRAMVELSPLGIVLSDQDSRILEVNPAFQRIIGYTREELTAMKHHRALTTGRYEQQNKEASAALMQTGRTGFFEQELIHKDGHRVSVSVNRTLLKSGDGRFYIWSMVEDISARRAAELQASTVRAQLEAFVEYAPAAMAMLDRDLRYIRYTQRWLVDYRLLGQNLIGMRHYDVFPKIPERWREVNQRCLQGEIERCDEDLFVRKNGSEQWLRWEVRPWRDADGNIGGIVMVTEDITARKRAAETLEARDQLLKKLSDRVPGLIYQFRLYPNGRTEFSYASEGSRDTYEMTPQELMGDGTNAGRRVHPDDRDRMVATTLESANSLSLWREEYRVILPTRGLRWLRGEGMPERLPDRSVVWHGYIADITERKLAEENLQALNNRLALATRAGGIGVWEWDLVHDRVAWDERMYEIYRIAQEPPLQNTSLPTQLIHPDDFARVERDFQLALAGIKPYDVEYRIIWPNGQERVLKSVGLVSRDDSGTPTRITGISLDLTESKKIERLKSEFVATVSHELRTPLTSIRGTLGLIAGGVAGPLPERAVELIQIAYKNSERLSLLINDILDIEKIESGRMEFELRRQPLVPLLEQAIEANSGYAQTYGVQLHLEPPERDGMVAVDAHRLLQVMANLLSNAVKFSPPHGRVDIAVRHSPDWVRVEVRDRGAGIPPEFQSRIFQKFSQADASDARVKGGTGLGLSISKAIVERMGGQIGFETQSGQGTTFYFELPAEGVGV